MRRCIVSKSVLLATVGLMLSLTACSSDNDDSDMWKGVALSTVEPICGKLDDAVKQYPKVFAEGVPRADAAEAFRLVYLFTDGTVGANKFRKAFKVAVDMIDAAPLDLAPIDRQALEIKLRQRILVVSLACVERGVDMKGVASAG